MIIVTGATGQLGQAIVEALLRRVSPSSVGASARDPAKAEGLSRLGVRVRAGDFERPDDLAHAFEGATQVLIVSSNARASGGDTLAQHRTAIAAARAAGARRIVYTSHMASNPRSAFAPARDHAATEELLAASGGAWTSLRNGFYAASGIAMMGNAFASGVLAAPADGPTSWTAHADLAEAAAVVLAEEGRFEGPTPPLTAASALDFAGLAAVATDLLGRPIERRVETDDALRARIAARGAPPAVAEIALGYFLAARAGEFAVVDGTLAALLGRAPLGLRELMQAKLAI